MFGVEPRVSHFINIFVFMLNCCLVYALAFKNFGDKAPPEKCVRSVVAMMLYGFHPALMESTAWVVGRFDLFVTFFSLLGLLFSSVLVGWVRVAAVSVAFAGAAFSKEMAVVFPLLLVLWLWLSDTPCWTKKSIQEWVLKYADCFISVFVVGLVYLWFRHLAQPDIFVSDVSVYEGKPWLDRFAYMGLSVAFYLKMMVFPFSDLSPIHPFDLVKINNLQRALGLATLFGVLFLFLFSCWLNKKVIWLLVLIFVALLPVMNILPLVIGGNIGHERFLALPLAFTALCAASLNFGKMTISNSMRKAFPAFAACGIAVWVVLSVANIRITLPLWKNEVMLWGWAYEKNPDFEFVRFNYVAALVFTWRNDMAEKSLDEIEKRDGELSYRLTALKGQLMNQRGEYKKAISYLKAALVGLKKPHEEVLERGIDISKAVVIRDNFSEAQFLRFSYGSLVEAYIGLSDYRKADEMASIMMFYQERYGPSYMAKAFASYGLGDKAKGDEYSRQADLIFPDKARKDVAAIREAFFKKLCSSKKASSEVCDAYHTQ